MVKDRRDVVSLVTTTMINSFLCCDGFTHMEGEIQAVLEGQTNNAQERRRGAVIGSTNRYNRVCPPLTEEQRGGRAFLHEHEKDGL